MSSEFERMNKPRAIEEWLDTYVWRRLGYGIVQAVRSTFITPNMLSLASVLAAFACAWAYYQRDLRGALLGLLFMVLHSAFDAADGQLARATGRGSRHGRTIDGIADNISFIAIYLAIALAYIHRHPEHTIVTLLLAAIAGLSHAVQCALVEYERQLYVYYVHGGSVPEREQPEVLRRELAAASGLDRLILSLQLNYSVQQRLLLGSSDRLQRAVQRVVAADPAWRTVFADRYRAAAETLVGRWALMAPNAHKLAIMAAAFVPHLVTGGIVHELGQVTFLFVDVALNLPLIALIRAQRRVDRRLLESLPATVQHSPTVATTDSGQPEAPFRASR